MKNIITKSFFEVIRPGVNTTFQDLGRKNLYHIGIPFSGAMDRRNFLISNKSSLRYLYNRKGPLSLSLNQGGGYINWNSLDPFPNIQLYFNPLTYSVSYKNKRPLLKTDKFNGFIIGFNSCRPKSLGEVKLKFQNNEYLPSINPNYLSE